MINTSFSGGNANRFSSSTDVEDRDTISEALLTLSADIPYDDWFRVAAAIKESGLPKAEFIRWSMSAPTRFDEAEADRVWEEVCAPDKPKIGVGTVVKLLQDQQREACEIPAPT